MAKAAKKVTEATPAPVKSGPTLVQDQKVAPKGKAGDQNDVPAKGQKKLSATVIAWRAQAKFEPTQKITLLVQGNPKRRTAATRYAFYKNVITVGQYQEVISKNCGSSKQAMVDMRWDYVSKFIDIK